MSRRVRAGFTLVEVIIALAIVGTLLVVAFGGLRVALAAWRQGEDRAEAHDHLRGVAVTLTRALGGVHPYKGPLGAAPEAVVLFIGSDDRVQFVTQVPPFPFGVPIAFTAVVVGVEAGETPGLVIRERALPNRDPFTQAAVVARDPGISALSVRYLDESGTWRDQWDAQTENALPRAVRLTFGAPSGARVQAWPSITVALRAGVLP